MHSDFQLKNQFEVNPVFRAKAEETVTLSSVNEYKKVPFDCMNVKESFRELDHHHQPIWQCVKLSKCKVQNSFATKLATKRQLKR